jgi:hypothetical protein
MENKTESYIILKPIAERFSRIANEMTNTEIKDLIKSSLKEQLRENEITRSVGFIIDEWFEDDKNIEFIKDAIEESIRNKLR